MQWFVPGPTAIPIRPVVAAGFFLPLPAACSSAGAPGTSFFLHLAPKPFENASASAWVSKV